MKKLSIYIHIPFCKSKCNYCSFYSVPLSSAGDAFNDSNDNICGGGKALRYNPDNYLGLLKAEIENASERFKLGGSSINSIYFGGGTPSVMPIVFFQNLLGRIEQTFKIANDAEITAEINPESGSFEKLAGLKALGINRLSIGAQSFNGGVLKTAGRIHNKNDIYNAVNNAKKAGFGNISLDLIIGLPGQTENIFYDDVREILDMEPEHISAYMLSIESGTKFYKIYNKKACPPFVSEETIAGYYETLCGLLAEKGYVQYEISNFSKKGYESRHNLNYWKRGEYLGLGPSASSFLRTEDGNEIRKTNISDLNKYANNAGPDFIEILTEKDKINEEIFLSLRTNSGIDKERLLKFARQDVINSFAGEGLMQYSGKNIFLTVKGMLLSSEIFARIMV